MSEFDGIKGHKGFAQKSPDASNRFEAHLKADRPSTTRLAGSSSTMHGERGQDAQAGVRASAVTYVQGPVGRADGRPWWRRPRSAQVGRYTSPPRPATQGRRLGWMQTLSDVGCADGDPATVEEGDRAPRPRSVLCGKKSQWGECVVVGWRLRLAPEAISVAGRVPRRGGRQTG